MKVRATVKIAALGILAGLGAWSAMCRAGGIEFGAKDAKAAHAATAELVAKHTPRDAGTLRGRLAAEWIMDRVSRYGIDAKLDAFAAKCPKGVGKFANVVVEFPSKNPDAQWIVVMSHFDTPPGIGGAFQGANDGGSTSGLLIALAEAVRRSRPHDDHIALVWTDAEECMVKYGPDDGFQGSAHLAEFYRRSGRRVKAAICLDMLGDKDLKIMLPANSTPVLRDLALRAAGKCGMKDSVYWESGQLVWDDHAQFLLRGFPAIVLIDFHYGPEPGSNSWWHTPEDTMDKLSEESFLKSGKLAAEMLNLLQKKRRVAWKADSAR